MNPVIKISTVHLFKDIFIKRIKKIRLMENSYLLDLLYKNDWKKIYKDLLLNIEKYTELELLNYDYYPLEDIILKIEYFGVDNFIDKLLKKSASLFLCKKCGNVQKITEIKTYLYDKYWVCSVCGKANFL